MTCHRLSKRAKDVQEGRIVGHPSRREAEDKTGEHDGKYAPDEAARQQGCRLLSRVGGQCGQACRERDYRSDAQHLYREQYEILRLHRGQDVVKKLR
jgi:hypothetical protein